MMPTQARNSFRHGRRNALELRGVSRGAEGIGADRYRSGLAAPQVRFRTKARAAGLRPQTCPPRGMSSREALAPCLQASSDVVVLNALQFANRHQERHAEGGMVALGREGGTASRSTASCGKLLRRIEVRRSQDEQPRDRAPAGCDRESGPQAGRPFEARERKLASRDLDRR